MTRTMTRTPVVRALAAGAALAGMVGAAGPALAEAAPAAVPAVVRPRALPAAPRARPGVTCPRGTPVAEPTFVPISCGDGSAFVIHVHWTYLSVTTGRAKGVALLDDCLPDCASGRYRAYPARLVFTGVSATAGRTYFTHLRVVFPSRHPAGVRVMSATY